MSEVDIGWFDAVGRLIGVDGLGCLLILALASAILHLFRGQRRFQLDRAALAVLIVPIGFALAPVYTDAPTPPWTLYLLPTLGIFLLISWIPTRKALGHSVLLALTGLAAHFWWLDMPFDMYYRDPDAMQWRQEREVEKTLANAKEMLRKRLPRDRRYRSGPIWDDELGGVALPTNSLWKWHTEARWHTPLTGLYWGRQIPYKFQTDGGTAEETAASLRRIWALVD